MLEDLPAEVLAEWRESDVTEAFVRELRKRRGVLLDKLAAAARGENDGNVRSLGGGVGELDYVMTLINTEGKHE